MASDHPTGWRTLGVLVAGCLLLLRPCEADEDSTSPDRSKGRTLGFCLPQGICEVHDEAALLSVTSRGFSIRSKLQEGCVGEGGLSCRPQGPARPRDGSRLGGAATTLIPSTKPPSPLPGAPSGRPGRPGAEGGEGPSTTLLPGEPSVPHGRPPAGPPRNRSRQGGRRPNSPPAHGGSDPPPGGHQVNPPGSPGAAAAADRNTTERRPRPHIKGGRNSSSQICRKFSKPLLVNLDKVQYLNDNTEMIIEHRIDSPQLSASAPNWDCAKLSTIPGTVNAQGEEVKAKHVTLSRRNVTGIEVTKSCGLDVDLYLVTEQGQLTVGNQTTVLDPGQVKVTVTLADPDSCFCHEFDLDSCVPFLDIFIDFSVENLEVPQSSHRTTSPSHCKTPHEGNCPMNRVDLGGDSWLEYPDQEGPAVMGDLVTVRGRSIVVRIPQTFRSQFSWGSVVAASSEVDPEVGEVPVGPRKKVQEEEEGQAGDNKLGRPVSKAPMSGSHCIYSNLLAIMIIYHMNVFAGV